MRTLRILLLLLLISAVGTPLAAAPILGQLDNFEDGTTMGWFVSALGSPHPAPPSNELGGPGGGADHYLELHALGGGGPASKLAALNGTQWAGDYIAAGVAAIAMDVNNFGATDLHLRLAFEDPGAGPPTNIAYSTNSIVVPAGSGWTSIVFPIAPGDLTAGLGSVLAALSNTTVLRIYHSTTANFPNPFNPIDTVAAELGMDNILAVPEPTFFLLMAGGLGATVARRLTRQRQDRA